MPVRTTTNSRVTRNDEVVGVVASAFTRKVVKSEADNRIIKRDILSRVTNSRLGVGLDTSRFKFFQIPTPSPDGAETEFTLGEAYTAGTLTVYRDQMALQLTVDFAETDPANGIFTVTSAPDSDEVVWANYINAY